MDVGDMLLSAKDSVCLLQSQRGFCLFGGLTVDLATCLLLILCFVCNVVAASESKGIHHKRNKYAAG